MSTRFSRDTGADLWTPLNALDDDIQSALTKANSALAVTSLGAVSLNTITARGTYAQLTAASVTTANMYPALGVGVIGVLEVVPSSDGTVIWQRWSSALGSWLRTYASSAWGSWLPLGSNLVAKATKARLAELSIISMLMNTISALRRSRKPAIAGSS